MYVLLKSFLITLASIAIVISIPFGLQWLMVNVRWAIPAFFATMMFGLLWLIVHAAVTYKQAGRRL